MITLIESTIIVNRKWMDDISIIEDQLNLHPKYQHQEYEVLFPVQEFGDNKLIAIKRYFHEVLSQYIEYPNSNHNRVVFYRDDTKALYRFRFTLQEGVSIDKLSLDWNRAETYKVPRILQSHTGSY